MRVVRALAGFFDGPTRSFLAGAAVLLMGASTLVLTVAVLLGLAWRVFEAVAGS